MALANVLRQVRDRRHFELEAVARFAQISPARLREMELGTREPTFRQLQRLAEAYGVPDYILGAVAIPNLPEDALVDFRGHELGPARLSPDAMQRIWSGDQVATFTLQLLNALNLSLPSWATAVPTGMPNTQTALSMRNYFDGWLQKRLPALQLFGTPDQVFFSGLRIFLEAQGTLIRVNDAPSSEYLGFFAGRPESLRLIFVNRRTSSRKAQLFTLVHEMAHQLHGVSGVSDPFKVNNPVETMCNKFAAEFLAPEWTFRTIVEQSSRDIRADVFQFVDFVAQQSLLSKHATAIRLVETGYVSQQQLGRWLSVRATLTGKQLKDEDSDASGETFGNPHAKRIGEVGYLPTYAAALAVGRNLIDFADVMDGLSISRGLQERAFSLATRRMSVAFA